MERRKFFYTPEHLAPQMLIERPIFEGFISERAVHVWAANLDQPTEVVEEFHRLLGDEDRIRISKYKTEELRNRRIVARGTLVLLLSQYLDSPARAIHLTSSGLQKPLLSAVHASDLRFNVSHAEDFGVFAFARGIAIGVDVERVLSLPDLDGVADNCLSEYEKNWFFALPDAERIEAFYRIWTIKEAYLKAKGTGLSVSPTTVEIESQGDDFHFYSIDGNRENANGWKIISYSPAPGFCAAIVVEGRGNQIYHFNWQSSVLNLVGA